MRLPLQGYLSKKAGRFSGWVSRYFQLDRHCLLHYATIGSQSPCGVMELNGDSVIRACGQREHAFKIETGRTTLTLAAESDQAKQAWCKAIEAEIAVARSNQVGTTRKRKGTHLVRACKTSFEIDNKFQFDKAIGVGAYGFVISATDKYRGHAVAIKKIPGALSDLVDARRTLREVRLLHHLVHPNINQLFEVLAPPTNSLYEDVYLVCELMDTDLHKAIYGRKRLTHEHIQSISYQMLCAISFMHSAGVIHRDLKPSNILLTQRCQLKICDFGMARRIEEVNKSSNNYLDDAEMTEYVVTRWYRSPEVLLRQSYSYAIDTWSAGCILAEMLGRKHLFPGKTAADMLKLFAKLQGKHSLGTRRQRILLNLYQRLLWNLFLKGSLRLHHCICIC
ncbi:unnamed protein product [Chrysoparadoxa australica]